MTKQKLCRVVFGSLLMGVGIQMTIWSNMGSDPMTLFWIGVSNILHISVGQANVLVCAGILVIVYFLDKKQIHVGSLINPVVVWIVTDTLAHFPVSVSTIYVQVLMMISGLFILAFGLAFYALADVGRGAYDALVFALCEKLKLSIGVVRTSGDIFFAILGVLLKARFAIGTLMAIVCMGYFIQSSLNILKKKTIQSKVA